MSEPFLGEIRLFGGNFAPNGWATCDGQLLPITQYSALFSVLGTTFGGDGRVTFGLPDLRGRVPVHAGQGPGLSRYIQGEMAGAEQITLLPTQIPGHTHSVALGCNNSAQYSTTSDPSNAFPSNTEPNNVYATEMNSTMGAAQSGIAGGSQAHQNVQPYTCVTFIIALEGIYPSRP